MVEYSTCLLNCNYSDYSRSICCKIHIRVIRVISMKLPSKFIKDKLKKWADDLPYPPTESEKKAYSEGLIDAAMYWKDKK